MTQGFVAQGGEFRVNTYTTNGQGTTSITGLAGGGYVATWASNIQDGSAIGVYGQRYDSSGATVGAEFQINTHITYSQNAPSVADLPDGGFVVVWQSAQQDGSAEGVYGQRYDSSGAPDGAEFQVNTFTTGGQKDAVVAGLSDGGFVVSWMSDGQDGDNGGIYAQRYDNKGNAAGAEFLVNSQIHDRQFLPTATGLSDGDFVIAWSSRNQDGSIDGVYGQRYDSGGATMGSEFLINTTTNSVQSHSSVTTLSDGGFVVTWRSGGQFENINGIFGQRYTATGAAVGSEFHISTYPLNYQINSEVAALSDGGFVVVWQSTGQDGDTLGIFGQRYDANGDRVGAETQINTYTNDNQSSASVTALTNGGFVVGWQSEGQDGDGYGIFAQQFSARLFGTSGNDTITDTFGADWIDGQAGDDLLMGRSGDDIIYGGDGVDTLVGNFGNDLLRGGNGDDMLYGSLGTDILSGNSGDDILNGGAHNDQLFGGAGNDQLNGDDGDDYLDGGLEGDTLRGGSGKDTLYGRSGVDILAGNSGADALYGGNDNDRLFGGAGADELNGDGGDDFLSGGNEDDHLFGGAGDDELNGDDGDDRLDGEEGNDLLRGNSGDDLMFGREGVDTLSGSAGVDRLYGGSQNDRLFGGDGDDDLNGGSNDDFVNGGADNDTLRGNSGDDDLHGNSGNDLLAGNNGADTLDGGSGDDTLFGGSDNDRLTGGSGNDSLHGGAGADQFVFTTLAGLDSVQDFNDGTDLIRYDGGVYGDLTIVASGSDVDITSVSGGHMLLLNEDVADITEADFVFV